MPAQEGNTTHNHWEKPTVDRGDAEVYSGF